MYLNTYMYKIYLLHSYTQVHFWLFYKFFNRIFYKTFSLFCKKENLWVIFCSLLALLTF